MRRMVTGYSVQQGDSKSVLVSDQKGWYVIREKRLGDRLMTATIVRKCASQQEALELADKLRSG